MILLLPIYVLLIIFVVLPTENLVVIASSFLLGALAVATYFLKNWKDIKGYFTWKFKLDITIFTVIFPLVAMLIVFLLTEEYTRIDSKLNVSYTILSLPFAFLQQVLLQLIFLRELEKLTKNKAILILVSSFVFSLMHLPDPRVVALSFVGGMLFVYTFLYNRSITTVSLYHWILANSTYYLLPLGWTGGLRVGISGL